MARTAGEQAFGSTRLGMGRSTGRLRIGVLGQLVVEGAPEIQRASHRRLLAIMLLDGGRRIQVDRLIERFWPGGAPATAKGALHTHVSALRRVMPDEVITTDSGGYRVPIETLRVDAVEFVELVRDAQAMARTLNWGDVVATAELALARWTGEPFADLAADAFAEPEITRLREHRLQAIELRAEALLELGRARESIADLEWATRSFPLRESLASLLALARQETGAHADALRALRNTEAALAELGLEPSPALRALEHQILTHRRHAGVREVRPLFDQPRSA